MAAAAAAVPPPMPSSHPAASLSARSPYLKPETTMEQLRAAAMAATQKTTGINTPVSASFPSLSAFPSSLHSPRMDTPLSASFRSLSSGSKGNNTPVTPPTAYLDFLRVHTPTFSPGSPHFTFQGAPNSARMAPPSSAALPPDSKEGREHRFSLPLQPLSARPSLPSQNSSSSVSSNASGTSSEKSTSAGATSTKSAPEPSTTTTKTKTWTLETIRSPTYPYPSGPTPRTDSFPIIPPSPGHPDRPSRRPSLRIPDSPSTASPTLVRSPATAIRSPKSIVQSPLSAIQPYSAGSKTSPVTIRHVVTRTIVYSSSPATSHPRGIDSRLARTASQPLVGEAPKGKRRKLERDQE